MPACCRRVVTTPWQGAAGFRHVPGRSLTWSRHDGVDVVVAVAGAQYGDGRVKRYVLLYPDIRGVELTVAGPRQLAAALLNAADSRRDGTSAAAMAASG